MAFFYIINDEGKYLGNIKGTQVLFHKATSATFLHRQTRPMIEKLLHKVEGLGAKNLTIMEAEDEDSAKEYMVAKYGATCAPTTGKKRGRPSLKATLAVHDALMQTHHKPINMKKIIEDIDGPADDALIKDCNCDLPLVPETVVRTDKEQAYIDNIEDPDTQDMFYNKNVNNKCMTCRRMCKQPATSVIYQCPQYQFDEFMDNVHVDDKEEVEETPSEEKKD